MFARRKTTLITKARSHTMAEMGAIWLMAAKSPLPNRRASVVRWALVKVAQGLSSRPKSTRPPSAKFSKTMKRMIPRWNRSPDAAATVRPIAARRGWPMKPRKKREMTIMVYQNIASLWYILIMTRNESPSMTSKAALSCTPEAWYQTYLSSAVAFIVRGSGVAPRVLISASPLPTAPRPTPKRAKKPTIPMPKKVETKSTRSHRHHAADLPLRSENSCREETKPASSRTTQMMSVKRPPEFV
mmetsp:Transcript_517/g.1394  ORF Transcript_517/g.1394 Transcript_517/m.1394 type:complete len:243 (+) Transcript_517:786-1514(+)